MQIDTSDAARTYGRGLLLGERVLLRPTREDDYAELDRWWEDPEQQTLQQTVVRPRPAGSNLDTFRRWSANDGPTAAGFSVESLEDGAFVGHVTVWGASLPERDANLGVTIAPDRVGRGYGTDAVRVMVRYAFLAMGLNRIQIEVFAFNTRARRAYAKAGFVEEGVRREAAFIGGEFADEVIMGLLRREWTP